MGFHQTAISNSFMGITPLRRSAEALPVACDALNARTTAVKEYHCTDIWIMAAELLSLLWNADISRSVCPSFRRRVSAQRLPIYRMYLICLMLRRRSIAPLSLSKSRGLFCDMERKRGKRSNTALVYSALNVRIALISLACSRSRISSSTP